MSFRLLTSCFPGVCLQPGQAPPMYHEPGWADTPTSSSESSGQSSSSCHDDGGATLIAYSDLRKALMHQYRQEKILSMARENQEVDREIKSAKSFKSVFSMASTNTGMFSAATEHWGNQNKYAAAATRTPVPTSILKNKSAPTNVKKKAQKELKSRTNYRYKGDKYRGADHMSDDGGGDWDFIFDLKSLRRDRNKREIDASYDDDAPENQVLHLKLKAGMADFYREEFLLSFPQYPIPKEMEGQTMTMNKRSSQNKSNFSGWRSSLPHLTPSDSSDVSSTTSEIQDEISHVKSRGIKIVIDDSPFLDLAVSGSLGLIDRKRSIGPQLMEQKKNIIGKAKDFIVLGNKKTGTPIAVCALKSSKGRPIVRIYSTKPRIESQEPIIYTNVLQITKDPLPLYTWAELRTKGDFPDQNTKYYLHASTGIKTGSKFHKNPISIARHTSPGSTELNIFSQKPGEEGTNAVLELAARIVVRTESTRCGPVQPQDTNYIISADKGADVANALCMTIIIDELMEFMMRKKCAMQAWKFINDHDDSDSQDGDDEEEEKEDGIAADGDKYSGSTNLNTKKEENEDEDDEEEKTTYSSKSSSRQEANI